MRNELLKILSFSNSQLRLIHIFKVVYDSFNIFYQNIISCNDNFLSFKGLIKISKILFVIIFRFWIPLKSIHINLFWFYDSSSKNFIFKHEFVNESLNLFLMLVKLLIIIASSSWQYSYIVPSSLILKNSFKQNISMLYPWKSA